MGSSKSMIDARDAIVLFADLQAGIVERTATNPLDRLKRAVGGLAKLARLLEIPVIVTGVLGEDGTPARIIPEIAAGFGEMPIFHRTRCDSLADDKIVSAIKTTGRRTLLISGVATELAVQLPALSAADQGYNAYTVLDACGGMSERSEQAALLRMSKAGVTAVSVMTLAGELAGDFREPKAQQAIEIVYAMAQS